MMALSVIALIYLIMWISLMSISISFVHYFRYLPSCLQDNNAVSSSAIIIAFGFYSIVHIIYVFTVAIAKNVPGINAFFVLGYGGFVVFFVVFYPNMSTLPICLPEYYNYVYIADTVISILNVVVWSCFSFTRRECAIIEV